jgi:hypothetical protein
VSGQILQQHFLVPIQEFRTQRADTIYFAVRFKDLTNTSLSWDAEEKASVKQMRAALIYSMELVPFYSFWTMMFGLPTKVNVTKAADEIASKPRAVVANGTNIAEAIVTLLGGKVVAR